MGCSASRPDALISRDQPSNFSSSSFSHSSFSSNFSPSTAASRTPVSRTLSLPSPLVHHPPICKGDTNHLVSLTSTTYGSLSLVDPPKPSFDPQEFVKSAVQIVKPLTMGDSSDPLSPDSVINTWELMEGLDELDFDVVERPLESPKKVKENGFRKDLDAHEYEFVEHTDSKPLWQHLSEESLLAKLDPDVATSYHKALLSKQSGGKELKEWLDPAKMEKIEKTEKVEKIQQSGGKELKEWLDPEKVDEIDKVEKIEKIGETEKDEKMEKSGKTEKTQLKCSSFCPKSDACLPGGENKVVFYYTSLRGIRKTYEECCSVRAILRGFNVCVDERDISMDVSYRKELQGVLGAVTLPQVFIRGMHVGGADEIRQLHDEGELGQLLEGIPMKDSGFVCESCGDARFLPCPNCSGSKKIFEEEEGKLRRCPICNENGLVRCPGCCS